MPSTVPGEGAQQPPLSALVHWLFPSWDALWVFWSLRAPLSSRGPSPLVPWVFPALETPFPRGPVSWSAWPGQQAGLRSLITSGESYPGYILGNHIIRGRNLALVAACLSGAGRSVPASLGFALPGMSHWPLSPVDLSTPYALTLWGTRDLFSKCCIRTPRILSEGELGQVGKNSIQQLALKESSLTISSDHAPGLCVGDREGLVLSLRNPYSRGGEMSWQASLFILIALNFRIAAQTPRQWENLHLAACCMQLMQSGTGLPFIFCPAQGIWSGLCQILRRL